MSKNASLATRREFLRQSAMLGLGLCSVGIAPLAAQAAKFSGHGHVVSTTRVKCGTLIHITAVHPSRDLGEEAVGKAFEEIDRLSAIFDRHKGDTAIRSLNDHGGIDFAPRELTEVMDRALRFNSLSQGSFDSTVAPVVDLFKSKAHGGAPLELSEAEIQHALETVGSQYVQASDKSIHLLRPGMAISLDGIAKGRIVDAASKILSDNGVHNHLINAGGDIRTSGLNPKGQAWTVAVEDPRKHGNYPAVMHMGNGAVATSGNYEVFFDKEKMFHHLVSPATGHSPHNVVSVTVRADSVMEADALSTAVFVMGPKAGIEFINSLPGRECLIVDPQGARFASRSWNKIA